MHTPFPHSILFCLLQLRRRRGLDRSDTAADAAAADDVVAAAAVVDDDDVVAADVVVDVVDAAVVDVDAADDYLRTASRP